MQCCQFGHEMASGCLFVSLTVLLIVIFVLLMALTHLAGTTVIALGLLGFAGWWALYGKKT